MADISSQDFSSPEHRLAVETTTIIALRDSAGIALKEGSSASYKEALRVGERLVPFLFHRDRSLLQREWESPAARECRAISNARNISFIDAVRGEIKRYEELLSRSSGRHKKLLQSKLTELKLIFQENRDDG